MSQQPTEYPAEWFPRVARKNAEAARQEVMSGLEELPTGVLAKVLEQGRALVQQSTDGLTEGGQ
jgi:hypothetical protein